MWRQGVSYTLLVTFVVVLLAGCGPTQLAVHAAKEAIRPPAKHAAPAYEGAYKVGAPYQVNGVWYFPKVEPDYDEIGVASWYGQEFHGRSTANGETYDMYGVSAAHPTLPLPTWVRVTNLENGRSLVVRVNDRGPFVDNRIIDLSFGAAQQLGFASKGLAMARVEALPGPAGGGAVAAMGAAQGWPGNHAGLYVQAGAFRSARAAQNLRTELASLGNVTVTAVGVDGRRLYRVRVGPLADLPRADATLATVLARGYPEARIVIE